MPIVLYAKEYPKKSNLGNKVKAFKYRKNVFDAERNEQEFERKK